MNCFDCSLNYEALSRGRQPLTHDSLTLLQYLFLFHLDIPPGSRVATSGKSKGTKHQTERIDYEASTSESLEKLTA
jgi:hypothetical protein